MCIEYKAKEDLEHAKKFAESIIVDLYESGLIEDDKFRDALAFGELKTADRIYQHDADIRNSCREIISITVAEAVKRAVL